MRIRGPEVRKLHITNSFRFNSSTPVATLVHEEQDLRAIQTIFRSSRCGHNHPSVESSTLWFGRRVAFGGLQAVDVFRFKDGSRVAVFGDMEHSAADLFCGGDILREYEFEERKDGIEKGVDGLVEASLRSDAVQRLDEARTEHVSGAEREFEDVVFGLAFDTGPHAEAAFGRVGAGSRDVEEGHLRVKFCERCGGGKVRS